MYCNLYFRVLLRILQKSLSNSSIRRRLIIFFLLNCIIYNEVVKLSNREYTHPGLLFVLVSLLCIVTACVLYTLYNIMDLQDLKSFFTAYQEQSEILALLDFVTVQLIMIYCALYHSILILLIVINKVLQFLTDCHAKFYSVHWTHGIQQ